MQAIAATAPGALRFLGASPLSPLSQRPLLAPAALSVFPLPLAGVAELESPTASVLMVSEGTIGLWEGILSFSEMGHTHQRSRPRAPMVSVRVEMQNELEASSDK